MHKHFVKVILSGCILFVNTTIAQNASQNDRLTQSQLQAGVNYIVDTIINGQTYYKPYTKVAQSIPTQATPTQTVATNGLDTHQITQAQTIAPKLPKEARFKDNVKAAQIDQKWLDELYSTSLYDTIYKTVTELDYKNPVYYPELPTDTLKARLADINARTPFNVEYNPMLESVIKGFLKNRRQSINKLIGLSHFYFPMFEETLDKHNLPLELKYLSIVESALKPRAKSRVGATGLWQFMYATGKQYKLDVSSYVDERSDPIKSTESASVYLSKLYQIFGDWDLALAAYNSGPGNVSKAIRRSGGQKNYWNLRSYLPRETAGYVPLFLATMYVMEYAEEHGFNAVKPQFNYIETDTVHIKHMISLDHVSETTGVKIEELQFLNPAYKLDIIPKVKGKIYTLRLPKKALGAFVTNEATIYTLAKAEFNKRERPLPKYYKNDTKTRYKVQQGDYLGKIARKFSVRVSQLKQWNGLRGNNLSVGQRLTIYPRNSKAKNSTASVKKVVDLKGKKVYQVKQGDTLWTIAQKYPGVSVQNIKEWNDISGTNLSIGASLVVSK